MAVDSIVPMPVYGTSCQAQLIWKAVYRRFYLLSFLPTTSFVIPGSTLKDMSMDVVQLTYLEAVQQHRSAETTPCQFITFDWT